MLKGGLSMILEKIPNVELEDLEGNPFSLHNLKDKKALIFMWASW
jgi:cytochrome oxidase Cu insertion factor (SCO1/SenC/PrrC family)